MSVDGSESDKYQYRMYLLASDTHLDRSGFNMNEEQLYEDELTKIRYILHRSRDQQGLFYVDIEVPSDSPILTGQGITWIRTIGIQYPSGTPGGWVMAWIDMAPEGEDFPVASVPQDTYYEFAWETESVPYKLSHRSDGSAFSYRRYTPNGPIHLNRALDLSIGSVAQARTLYPDKSRLDIALDPVQMVEHHIKFTLPKELGWSDEFKEILKAGPATLTYTSNHLSANGVPVLSLDSNTENIAGGTMSLNEDGTLDLVVYQKPSADGSGDLDAGLSAKSVQVIDPENFDANNKIKITADVSVRTVYTFHEAETTNQGKVTWTTGYTPTRPTFSKTADVGDDWYTLRLNNNTLFSSKVVKISDTLPEQLYMDGEDIRQLFTLQEKDPDTGTMLDNSNLACYLTLTIQKARIYQYDSTNGQIALGTVTLTDGKTQHILTAADTDEAGTNYTTEDVKFTYVANDADHIMVQIGGDEPQKVEISDLDNYFVQAGIAITNESLYAVEWNFPENHQILSSDDYTLRIPIHEKTTFQRLIDDNELFYGATDGDSPREFITSRRETLYNTANAYLGDVTLSGSSEDVVWSPECSIEKTVDATDVTSGQVLNYGITAYSTPLLPSQEGLPVVDVMSGVQVLLAPVSQNKKRPWVEEAKPPVYTDTDGTQYYKLELPEDADRYIYDGVWLGEYYADSVTVIAYDKLTAAEQEKYKHPTYQNLENAIVQDGMVTEIRWYLTSDTVGNLDQCRTLTYKALADADYSRPGAPQANTLNNIAYLNDRDGDRVFYTTGILPVRSFSGAKELLDDEGNPIGNSSTILAGQTVHYRLSVVNQTSKERSLTKDQLWDVLPNTGNVFAWNTETVKLRYAYANTDGEAPFSPWSIDTDAETQETRLTWPNGVTVPANDTLYIYVDLTFPAKETGMWDKYCEAVGSNTLINTFRVLNGSFSVTHTLALPTEAYIQKGVDSIEYKSTSSNYVEEYISSHHIFYEQAAGYTSFVTYYAMIYNQGPGPLYLTELQDLMVSKDGSAVHLTEAPKPITTSIGFNNVPDGATMVQATITSTQRTSDKGDLLVFRFAPSQASSDKPTISYDAAKGMYYLEPNQALAFSYKASINGAPDTVVNTLSMPLCDPYGSGVSLTDDMEPKRYPSANDGDCDQWTASQAADQGFTSSYAADDWLWSRVSLQKGATVPGLEKRITQKRDQNGNVTSCDGFAGPLDALQWTLTVRNTGENVLTGYTITDTLPDNYTLAEGQLVVTKTELTKSFTCDVRNIQRSNDGKITSVDFFTGGAGTTVPVNGQETPLRNLGYPNYSITLSYNETGQMVIRFKFTRRSALPKESVNITFWTENATNIQNSTTYINSAVLTLPEQDIDYDEVSIGRVLRDEEGNGTGILARGAVTVTTGYSTASLKKVTEQDVPSNTTDSLAGDAIALTKNETGYSGFTYELQVVNSAANARSVQWMTLIDNLPELEDHFTLNQDVERDSEFKVNFQNNPNVKVWYVTSDGQQVNLTEDQFTVQYSTKTSFSSADWGSVTSGTIIPPAEEEWTNTPTSDSRSIRIVMRNDSDEGVIPANATVHVSFDCQVAEPQSVEAGQIAWNSFGYRYQMHGSSIHLESAPLDVGVMIPDYPRLEKSFVDENGLQSVADKDADFRFLIYTGSSLEGSYKTGSELLTALVQDNRTFSLVTMPFTAEQEEQTQKLKDLKVYTYNQNTLTETEQNWVWTHNETYTVLELGETDANELGSYWDYQFYRLNNMQENQYSFTYNKETSQLIRFQNQQASRQLDLIKVDQSDTSVKLPGAIFALYSADTAEQWTETELQEAYTTLQLTDAQKQAVESHKSVTLDGNTYTLCNLGVSDSNGLISWKELPGKTYCYQELWAPEGYQILVQEPQSVSFEENNNYIRQVTKTVENSRVYSLPKTGGIGRWQIPAAGFILAAFALLLLRKKRRKGNI